MFFFIFSALIKTGLMTPSAMTIFDNSPFLLNSVADRFEILLRRYHLFSKEVPLRFQQWLRAAPTQKRVFATLESICSELFPDQLSIVSVDFPHRWMLPVACVALKHYVSTLDCVELSECGRALRVVEIEELPGKKAPHQGTVSELITLRGILVDSMSAASRSAALEVRVAHLESKLRGELIGIENNGLKKRKKLSPLPLPETTTENVFVYLSECRAEAMDALTALHKTNARNRRQSEKLAAANDEITRLKAEIETMVQTQRAVEQQQEDTSTKILPKRALSLAGDWNLTPNDLLAVTPVLIQSVEKRGGAVIRRDGMHVCFSSQDKPILIEAAVETMGVALPHYKRRD